MKKIAPLLVYLALMAGCNTDTKEKSGYPTTGYIERLDPGLDSLILKEAKIEIIATGLDWSEGPLWVEKENMLLFSDVHVIPYSNGQKPEEKKYTSLPPAILIR